jgi:hypothetical protein
MHTFAIYYVHNEQSRIFGIHATKYCNYSLHLPTMMAKMKFTMKSRQNETMGKHPRAQDFEPLIQSTARVAQSV